MSGSIIGPSKRPIGRIISIPGRAGPTGTTLWSALTGKPAVIAEGADQAAARASIGAGTSSLAIGTSSTTAKAGNYQPTAANISDSSAVGRSVVTATDAAAARNAIGMSRMPVLPHGKLKGGNIVPKPSSPTGDSTGPGGLWAEWDWDNWIKPQIDRAIQLGLNAVRINCAPQVALVRYSTAIAKLSQATYIARCEQIASYCLGRGLYLYPTLTEKYAYMYTMFGGLGGVPPWDFQDELVTDLVAASAAAFAKYPNVIAFDVFQEGLGSDGDGLTVADVIALYAAIRVAAPGIPLTTSDSSGSFGNAAYFWANDSSLPYQLWTYGPGGADFADLHIYLDNVDPVDLDGYIERVQLPIMFGEYGAAQVQTPEYRASLYEGVRSLHNKPGILGSFLWALADQAGTGFVAKQFGVWDNTGFSQPTFPLPAGVTPLSTTAGQRAEMTGVLHGFGVAEIPQQASASSSDFIDPTLHGATRIAQASDLSLYNTTDETTNYERARHWWNGDLYRIDADAAGSGVFRNMRFSAAGSFLMIDGGGTTVSRSSTGSTQLLHVTATGLTSSSGTQSGLLIDPTINQSGTAGYAAILINLTQTATGSGAKKLIDAKVGGTSKFAVDSTGVVTATPSTTAGTAVVRGSVPATATSTGVAGQIATDGSFIYVCTATNTWVRAALATW